nr:unnamed protein product [Brassica oleracea]
MFLGIYRGTCSSEYSEERCPSVYSERVFINGSIDGYMSKNTSIDVYPDEVLLRYIPRRFPTNWCSSEFPRKCVSSEFRRIFPTEFRGKKKFRGIISDDLFRRYVVGITLFRRNSDDFFPQYPCCFLVVKT